MLNFGTDHTSYACPDLIPPHPSRTKSTKFKKTIMIVSLSNKEKGRDRQRLEYTTVTQVVVSLSPSQCTVQAVGDLVAQQVGFDVVLLDSKCY
jgi:urease accessory protein UreE